MIRPGPYATRRAIVFAAVALLNVAAVALVATLGGPEAQAARFALGIAGALAALALLAVFTAG